MLWICCLATLTATAQTTKHVLFLGNSYTSVNNLPQMTAQIANSMGDALTYVVNAPGGCTFMQHCTNQSMSYICQGGWDAVVLQEQSQMPAFPDWQVEQEVFPYAKQLVDSVYAHSPCGEPMFYMTWGRKNGDQYNAAAFPPLGTYEGMDSLLALRYTLMAQQDDAALCPVGRVWHRLRTTDPKLELYQPDESHPTVAGTYAAACAFYVMLFHRDPMGITFSSTLDGNEAQTIRKAVRTVVYDSLSRWQRPQPRVEPPTVDSTHGPSVWVSLPSTDASVLRLRWGDGTDTSLAPATAHHIAHTYADSGQYTLVVVGERHCMSHTDSLLLHVEAGEEAGIALATAPAATLWPNPARQTVHWRCEAAEATIEIYDMRGQMRVQQRATGPEATLDVGGLEAGLYLVWVRTPQGIAVGRLAVTR